MKKCMRIFLESRSTSKIISDAFAEEVIFRLPLQKVTFLMIAKIASKRVSKIIASPAFVLFSLRQYLL